MSAFNSGFEAAQQMGNLWMEYFTKMATASMAVRPGDPPTDAARSIRDATFAAMGQQADKFMRTPEFLAMVKQSLDASIAFRKQLNDLFTQAHHSVQGVAIEDVNGLNASIRRLETRILGRIEDLCDRLDNVSTRLEALEKSSAASNHKDNGQTGAVRGTAGRAASAAGASNDEPEHPASELAE
jgi:hypothetical protein